jgi:hypothetical protein
LSFLFVGSSTFHDVNTNAVHRKSGASPDGLAGHIQTTDGHVREREGAELTADDVSKVESNDTKSRDEENKT